MAFATIQAIGYILVLLPVRAQLLLKIVRVGKLRNILKLIDADDYFKTFLLGNPLRKIKNLIGVLFYRLPIEVD